MRLFQVSMVGTMLAGLVTAAIAAPAGDAGAELRVLKLRYQEINHPHRDSAGELRLLTDFARHNGMRITWIDAVQPDDLQRRLERGEGDVVVADLAPQTTLGTDLLPSLSMGAYEYRVMGRSELEVSDPTGLAGLSVAVTLSSPLWSYLTDLEQTVPDLRLVVLPDNTTRAALLAGIERGDYDAGVVSARPNEDLGAGRPALKRLFPLSAVNSSVWRFSAANAKLRDAVDSYLKRYHGAVAAPARAYGDLDAITERRVMRVITRVDPQNYFLRKGRRAGFEYELVRKFARSKKLAVEFLVAKDDAQVLEWLRKGIGDLVTTRTDAARVERDRDLQQSRLYFHSAPTILNHRDAAPLKAADMAGKRVAVLRNSVQHRALGQLVASGVNLRPLIFNPDTPLARIARAIERHEVDAAVVDAYALADLLAAHPRVQAGASMPSTFNYAWTLRSSDVDLGAAVDDFMRAQFRMETYNILAQRYFDHKRFAQFSSVDEISPFDAVVRRHAERFDFDWRLIVALMYQESKFNPDAESPAGARGLMQLLPATARALGVNDPFDPDSGIGAGVAYLDQLRQRFEHNVSPRERNWFALAAYNSGFQRVDRARRQARRDGLDPNRWFGNVERVMREMTGGGGGQTVIYVRAIRSLYSTYSRLHETLTAGIAPPLDIPAS